ncbi:nucleotidyltransferase domain-containing protein [Candidatus Woesearchaeota archaeon]|nr:nucleotidyltransferase domain-containing protein [Candidatus Woesearchaeota archaeon]
MSIKNLLEKEVKKIKPVRNGLKKEVNNFLKQINTEIRNSKIKAKAVIGGSMAKDTHLAGDHDCDIFVKFDRIYQGDDISIILGKLLKSIKHEIVHGSRDYFRVNNTIKFEIVPVLDIIDPKEADNVTDMSPLHVAWVKQHKGFNDEIRLAKQFCKSCKVYGAESYIKGFSGHVLDILVIYYKGFIGLLKASQKWKEKEVVDPEKHYKKDALNKLNRSKIDSPIIVIDPVLPERNAAAALSYEKLEMFQKAAADFIKLPTEESFVVHQVTEKDIRSKVGEDKLILLHVIPMIGKEDVVGAKLLKAYQQINNQIRFYDFTIKFTDWTWNKKRKAMFWYVVEPKDLVPIRKWIGPPLTEKERVKSFKLKYIKTFTEDGRICTYVKRKYVRSEDLIRDIITSDEHLYEKVKTVRMG